MGAPCKLDQSFVVRSHLADTVVKINTRYSQYHLSNSRNHISEVDPFTGKAAAWTQASISTHIFPTVPSRTRIWLYLPSPSSMQRKPHDNRVPTLFKMSHPSMQSVQFEKLEPSPTA